MLPQKPSIYAGLRVILSKSNKETKPKTTLYRDNIFLLRVTINKGLSRKGVKIAVTFVTLLKNPVKSMVSEVSSVCYT